MLLISLSIGKYTGSAEELLKDETCSLGMFGRSLNFVDIKTPLQRSEIQPVPTPAFFFFFFAGGLQRRYCKANPGLSLPVLGRSGSKKAFNPK